MPADVKITKDTLKLLNAAIGKLDTDSGSVFSGFIGRLDMTDRLYHGILSFTDVGDTPPPDAVSLGGILNPSVAKDTRPTTWFEQPTEEDKE